MNSPAPRLASIDIFRALTMFLMIFVNDLWTLKDIPVWLEHTQAHDDGMGLADTVFPAFLFIVGLSIPFAVSSRLAKGESKSTIIWHIVWRSAALLIMGYCHVNLEHYNSQTAMLPKPVWQILVTISFFLLFLDYPAAMLENLRRRFRIAGAILLVTLVVLYAGGTGDQELKMKPHWWGILGLIGWSYLLCGIIYVISNSRLLVTVSSLIFFLAFNIAAHAHWLTFLQPIKQYVWIVGDGAMPALVMAGVLAAQIYSGKVTRSMLLLTSLGGLFLAGGFLLRPYWGISKILATPSWVMICTAISLWCFTALIYIADIRKKQNWFAIIRPAGTSTLTAYLLPYIHYALYSLIGVSLPLVLRTGAVGIAKSLLYALVIILITGLLEKWKLRLKI